MIITRLINIFSNGGMYFVTPLVGTTLAQSPSIEASFYSMLIGIVLSCLGLIALYVGNIHTEVVNRPLYLIRQRYENTTEKKI